MTTDKNRAARSWILLAALVLVVQGAYVGLRQSKAEYADGFLQGDCFFYQAIAQSLIEDQDLNIADQMSSNPTELATLIASGQLAVDKHGKLAPKHPIIMPLLSFPFYLVARSWGLLIFNVLIAALLVIGIGFLAGGGTTGRILTVLALVATPFLNYTYNYSSDLLGAAFIVWGFVAVAHQKGALAGVAFALSVWIKLTNVVFLPLGVLALALGTRDMRSVLRFMVGGGVVLALMAGFNWWIYGGPLTSGYQRSVTLRGGEVAFYTHTSLFTDPFFPGVVRQLFDPQRGMLVTAPLWFLWPAGAIYGWMNFKGRERAWPVVLGIAVVAPVVMYASYSEWDTSHYGNRFLFPSIAVALAMIGLALSPLLIRVQRLRGSRGALQRAP